MSNRFVKIGADGAKLPDDATKWVAVLDNTTQLIWTVEESKTLTWKKAKVHVAKLDTAGFTDWYLPSVEELFLLADRAKYSPAIDTAFFPDCKSEWYWTATPAAFSPGVYAWFVSFGNGSAGWGLQGSDFLVRAVRSSQS